MHYKNSKFDGSDGKKMLNKKNKLYFLLYKLLLYYFVQEILNTYTKYYKNNINS